MEKRTIHSKFIFNQNSTKPRDFDSIIVGYKIKTPENIGSILRLADNVQCTKVLIVSETENVRNSKIKRTASSSYNSDNWKFCKESDLISEIPEEYKWVAVETTSDSENIFKLTLPKKIAIFVGNEISGIDQKILDNSYQIAHIPILGKNTSLNVTHALAVALFEWQRQMTK